MAAFTICLIASGSNCARIQRASEQKPSTIPNEHFDALTRSGFVNDFARAVDDDTHSVLENALGELKTKAQIDLAVVVLKTTSGQPVSNYSLSLAQTWNVGNGGDGILLLVAIDDRQWHIQVSRKLERDLPNDKVREIGDSMKPSFVQGRYGEGIRRCVDGLMKFLAAKRGFAPIIIPEPLLRGRD